MLRIHNLNHSFEEKVIFNHAKLEIDDGEIIWLKGKNGSGKTTLFRILAGILKPSTTEMLSISFNDRYIDLGTLKEHVNFISNCPYLFEYLSGRENIDYLVSLFDLKQKYECIMGNIERLNLIKELDAEVFTYSLGMKAKLYLGVMLERETPIILLDEILSSIDAQASEIIIKALEKKNLEEKCSLIFSSHLPMTETIENTKYLIIENERLERYEKI